jgi:NitT/TauT family transport system substrate-binding protein
MGAHHVRLGTRPSASDANRMIRLCNLAGSLAPAASSRPGPCRNLKVEKINFAGATDQLLELLASGKADAGVAMALASSSGCRLAC